MPSDYYSDTAEAPGRQASADTAGEQETTMIPKSMCPGMEVGDKLEMRIVAEHGDEYSVAYEGSDKSESDSSDSGMESEAKPPMMGGGMGEMMQ